MPTQAQQILEAAGKDIDGMVAMGVVGMDGIHIAQVKSGDISPEAQENYGVKFALVMSLVRKSLAEIKLPDLEENLVEHGGGWVLSRFIGDTNFYLGVAVSKDAVLGNVRMVAKKTAQKLAEVL
jgi:predicted regulator of Ras-like GTPase activity (Roadblock/LC7/MglB family)